MILLYCYITISLDSIMTPAIKIIGFSGKIGVGKNYIAEQIFGKKLYEMGYNVHILAVADQVKYELGSRFTLIKDNNNFVNKMDNVFEELFLIKSGETRTKLQMYGTDYCRNGDNWNIKDKFTLYNEPTIWIKGLYLQIKNILSKSYDINKDIFLITDIRFQNEAEFIKIIGGHTIRIISQTRNNLKLLEEANKNYTNKDDVNNFIHRIKNHESEINLDTYHFNHTINNEPDNQNVKKEIDNIINILF